MPSTRLLSRRSSVNESNETTESDSKDESNLNSVNDHNAGLNETKEYKNQRSTVSGRTLDVKSRNNNLKSENNRIMGIQNQQQMIQVHTPYPQHMNRQVNVNQNQHNLMNNPNMQLPNMGPGGPGYPPLGFPSFPTNMNEYTYLPNMRYPSKDSNSMDILNPKVVLGRLGTNNPTPSLSSFMTAHSVNFGPTAHYSQYFDPREEPDNEFAFLDYSGGVVYDNGSFSHGGRYLVFWEYKGRIWRKSFTVDMFGPEGAKELAETFWVSKMRAIQLYNKNKQDKLLRNDKKGSSGRKKKPSSPVNETVLPNLSLDPNLAAQYILQDQNKKDLKEVFQKPKKETVEEFEFKVREPRIDKTELEGLIWDEENNTWSFEKAENNEIIFHKIQCQNKLDGFKEIKTLKTEYENKLLKEYETCNVKGVVYDKARMNWKVSYYVASKGVKKNKMFSVTKLGYNKAKESALTFKELVDACDGDEPEDNTPEAQPQEELFSDPMVEHYHNVLSSIAVKQFKDALS